MLVYQYVCCSAIIFRINMKLSFHSGGNAMPSCTGAGLLYAQQESRVLGYKLAWMGEMWGCDVITKVQIQSLAQPTTTDSVYTLNDVIIFCFSFCSVYDLHSIFLT
jgi:hypothetical protein